MQNKEKCVVRERPSLDLFPVALSSGRLKLSLVYYPFVPKYGTKEFPHIMYFNSGVGYLEHGDYTNAWSNFYKAIKERSRYFKPHVNMGFMCSIIGKYELAKEFFDDAINLQPKVGGAYFNRALINMRLGKHQEVLPDLVAAKEDRDFNHRKLDGFLEQYHTLSLCHELTQILVIVTPAKPEGQQLLLSATTSTISKDPSNPSEITFGHGSLSCTKNIEVEQSRG